jgi:hypothetical protein
MRPFSAASSYEAEFNTETLPLLSTSTRRQSLNDNNLLSTSRPISTQRETSIDHQRGIKNTWFTKASLRQRSERLIRPQTGDRVNRYSFKTTFPLMVTFSGNNLTVGKPWAFMREPTQPVRPPNHQSPIINLHSPSRPRCHS